MSKTSNKQQIAMLFSLMEGNVAIARGFYKGGKDELARFWHNAEAELNSLGPPIKSIQDWKKVWADQKKYVRQKVSQNVSLKRGTGGGPNTEIKLSPIEESIFNLINMKDSVEGVEGSKFGLDSAAPAEEYLEEEYLEQEVEYLFAPEPPENISPAKTPKPTKNLVAPKQSTTKGADILEANLEVQRELLENIKVEVVEMKEQQQSVKKVYRFLDKMCENQKKHFIEIEKLKREETVEMKRHNALMEELRIKEVQYKLRKEN